MTQMLPDNIREIMIHNAFESQEGIEKDHAPVVKLYSQYGKAIWLLSELDPTNNIAYGLCDLGNENPEISYVSITHLESIKHARLKVPMIEIDPTFEGQFPLSVYAAAAKKSKRITDKKEDLTPFLKK
jgi:hypothetical protein